MHIIRKHRILLLLLHKTEVTSERRERPTSADRRTESPYHNRESLPAQQPPANADGKAAWNYPGLDLMATGAFWQNYSG